MKIKNEYVEIKMGNKSYKKENMILNTYINRLFASQLNTTHELANITECYLKIDTPIENVSYDTILSGSNDFDIEIYPTTNYINKIAKIVDSSPNNVKLKYSFDNSEYLYNNKFYYFNDFSMFNGKKITAIGFGHGDFCFTFLDTSNMNIIINSNETMQITRIDSFKSDGICKGFDYPLHLINDMAFVDYDENTDWSTKAQLYSVGFGNKVGYMEEEYLINDVETDRDDTSITFNVSRTKKVGHYPSEDLHFTFYPTMDNSKYIIFKYRLYRIYLDDFSDEPIITDLNEYYTMSKPNETFGDLNIKLEIERL